MTKPVDDDLVRALLARCARRDERALTEIHALLARRIHAFAFNRVRDELMAETVVVDTLYEIWKSAGKFRGDSRVSTWVLGIARFKLLALLRQAGPTHEDIDEHTDLPGEWEDGAQALSRWQESQIVRQCMTTLSEAHRECLHLVYFEGMALAEVAELQGVPGNTVKTRLFHARKQMRHCVERNGLGVAP